MEDKTSLYARKIRKMNICYHHYHPAKIRPW